MEGLWADHQRKQRRRTEELKEEKSTFEAKVAQKYTQRKKELAQEEQDLDKQMTTQQDADFTDTQEKIKLLNDELSMRTKQRQEIKAAQKHKIQLELNQLLERERSEVQLWTQATAEKRAAETKHDNLELHRQMGLLLEGKLPTVGKQ